MQTKQVLEAEPEPDRGADPTVIFPQLRLLYLGIQGLDVKQENSKSSLRPLGTTYPTNLRFLQTLD